MRRSLLSLAMLAAGAALLAAATAWGGGAAPIRNGGTFRIAIFGGTGNVDPALLDGAGFDLVEATCARVMSYADQRPPAGWRLHPEVASRVRVSRDGKTYTFTLRKGFRFSNRAYVRADAFAWAITRVLRLAGKESDAVQLVLDIVGAERVVEGKAKTVSGLTARGIRLVIELTRPAPAFPARLAAPWFCAVPPKLRLDREGVATFPAAGPYYVAENVGGQRLVLKRNRWYGGRRPHHVESFVVDGHAVSLHDVVDRIERGSVDWGPLPSFIGLQVGLQQKYGVNKSRFFVKPGLVFRHYHLNTSRGIFKGNPKLRRAVNFAIDRAAIRAAAEGPLGSVLTDQYLPPWLPGFRNEQIYLLTAPNLRRAKALARGHMRGGKAVLYTYDIDRFVAAAQVLKRNLAKIDLDVEVKPLPAGSYYERIVGKPGEPWDIAFADWAPSHLDSFGYLNELLDGQFVGDNNLSHFDSPGYNALLRRAARLGGKAHYRAYGKLDVQLAKYAAPIVAISYLNETTFLSKQVDPRCIVLRPTLDLTAVCLKR